MNQNFKQDIEDLRTKFHYKLNEIRYSKEYLDFKDGLEETASTSKKLFKEDLKNNGLHFGRVIKKLVKRSPFRQLLSVK